MPELRAAPATATYDEDCRRCDRLAGFLAHVRAAHPAYWCRPVPPFGETSARLVIVGLAPGMHGANASGRPFTGDHAGILLYETLYDYGFATLPVATARGDGLRLSGCRITNAVKCLPPGNKPLPAEVRSCNTFLAADLRTVPEGGAILALGRIAHAAALRALGHAATRVAFAHGACHALPGRRALFDSYHCSRYNTNTRRLTPAMFRAVFDAVAAHLAAEAPAVAAA
ncbi:MAG: uracil-DNA glycosylase [Betaproteobacteria bacterium]|nr:uracil-DNA glycosylase [Betaproteobacteria bacterium]